MARVVQLWRGPGSLMGMEHGLNVKPDVHVETVERTLVFQGPVWQGNGAVWIGPLTWTRVLVVDGEEVGVVPSRYGPPDWRMPLADMEAMVDRWNLSVADPAARDELVIVDG